MAGAWTSLSIKDATGTTRTMRAWDESGAGTGPFSFGQVFSDGSGSASQPGQVGSPGDVVTVTLTVDTSAYADGDVLADTQTITNAMRIAGGHGVLQSLQLVDPDAQGQPLDLYFFSVTHSLGTENAAPTISDADVIDMFGPVAIASSDYGDLGGCKVASVRGIGLMMEADAASRDLYVGAISRGTGTYAGGSLTLKLAFLWD
jgi:hypothetical protein